MNTNRSGPGNITRKQFLRNAGLGAAALGAAGLGLSGTARAADASGQGSPNPDGLNIVKAGQPYGGSPASANGIETEIWVYPAGSPAVIGTRTIAPDGESFSYNSPVTIDSRNIQWAINNVASGGAVVLKAPADPAVAGHVLTEHIVIDIPIAPSPPFFDPHLHRTTQWGSRIEVSRDVEILGDAGNKLIGGHHVFSSTAFVVWAVRGINFEKSGGSAISMWKSKGLEVQGCSITQMKPEVFYAPLFNRSVPVGIVPAFVSNNPFAYYFGESTNVVGYAIIKDNYLDPGVRADLQFAVIFQSADCDGVVSGNRILNCSITGIASRWTHGNLSFTDNTISPGNVTHYIGSVFPFFGDGIDMMAVFDGSVYVARNAIMCANPRANGIALASNVNEAGLVNPNPLVVEKNQVDMEGTSGGAFLVSDIFGCVLKSNDVQGNMGWGLLLDASSGNTMQGNNLSRIGLVDAESGHLVLVNGSSYNALVGLSGIVVDDGTGTGNNLTGFTKKALGPTLGARLSEAQKQRKLGEDMEKCLMQGGTWDAESGTCKMP